MSPLAGELHILRLGHPLREELRLIAATLERSLPLQIAAEIIAASNVAGTDVEFAVLFRMVEIWRARRDSNS
jgi:hypothetical protein